MQQKAVDLKPTDQLKVALGKELAKYLKLSFQYPLSQRSFTEFGNAFCLLFNDQVESPTFSEQMCDDFTGCLSDISLDSQQFFGLLQKMMAADQPDLLHHPADDFITDPQLLDKTASLMSNIQKNGLRSVLTEEMISPANESPNQVNVITGAQIGNYLAQGLRIFRISRSKISFSLDSVTNLLIIGSVLVKSIHQIGQIELFKQYLQKQSVQDVEQKYHSWIHLGVVGVNSAFIPEVNFLLDFDVFDPKFDHDPHQSHLCCELKKQSKDLEKLLRLIMPIIKLSTQFVNIAKVTHDKLMAQKIKAYNDAVSVFETGKFPEAYFKLRSVRDTFGKATLSYDLAEQERYCHVIHQMAVCKEHMGDYFDAYVLYHHSISARAKCHFDDVTLYCFELSEKLMDLEAKLDGLSRDVRPRK